MQALTKENNVVRRCLCCAPQWLEWTKIAEQFLEPCFINDQCTVGIRLIRNIVNHTLV